jgi:ribonuclease R
MGDHIGETFQGKISGITEFGFYVEVNDNFCEGMVPIHSLMDDYYEFDERNYCLRGRRRHHVYSIGDNVMIRVVAANLERRQLDFELVEKV